MGYLLMFFGVGFTFTGLATLLVGEFFASLMPIGIGAGTTYLGYKLVIRSRSTKKKKKDAEQEFLNLPIIAGAEYKHIYQDTAIAINKKQRKVILANPKLMKAYDFSQIKSWKYELNTSGTVYGAGLNGGIQALAINARNSAIDRASSGFFIQVKDIENPEWRISFDLNDRNKPAKQELLKWMEIFDQFVNENV